MENNNQVSRLFSAAYLAGKYAGKPPVRIVCEWNVKFGSHILKLGGQIAIFGIGPGRNLPSYMKMGYSKITGFDFNEVALQQCQQMIDKNEWQNIDLKAINWKQTGMRSKSCAAVFAINTFQFVEGMFEAEAAWQEASRILVPEGLLFVRMNSDRFPEYRNHLKISDSGRTYQPTEGSRSGIIKHNYSEDEIKNLAQKAGFKIIEIDHKIKIRGERILSPEYMRKYGETLKKRVGTKAGRWRVVFKKK